MDWMSYEYLAPRRKAAKKDERRLSTCSGGWACSSVRMQLLHAERASQFLTE